MTELTMAKAINAGLRRSLSRDPKVLLFGEDIGRLGGVFRVTDGLQAEFGEDRVIDAPLAESTIVGASVGLAMRGYRTVVEIQFDGFVFPAFDQIVTQVAKYRTRSAGHLDMPLVIRIPYGGGIGAVEHHSESPEAYFCHTPGLRVLTPSTPMDAYILIQQAIASPDPVIFLEPKRRYWERGEVDLEIDALDPSIAGSPWQGRIVRAGSDVTVACYGPMVHTCHEAAEAAAEDGVSIEVVDMRSLSPLDIDLLASSVEKTGRLVIVHEAPGVAGLGAEIATSIMSRCFFSLEAPVVRVCGWNTPYPPSRLESIYLPDVDRVLDGIDEALR